MFLRSKRAFSLFVACAMLLSIVGSAVEAAVATISFDNIGGKIVDINVKFDSQSTVKIDQAVLYIDNVVYEKKKITPAKQGVIAFDWNTSKFSKGQHYIEVKLFANNKLVTSINGAGVVSDSIYDVNPPKVSLANVVDGEVVSGSKLISINAKDDSGDAPIVSLLVDKKLKLMQNTQPYSYNLDTTALSDGKHVVEVYAFDLEGNQSDIMTYNITVDNGNLAVADAKSAKINKTTPIDLGTPKTDSTIASRPTLSNSVNTEVGRISDSEISASINSVKTTPIITSEGEGILSAPKTVKTTINEPVISKVSSNPVSNNNGLKIASLSGVESSSMTLSVPKIQQEEVNVLVAKNNVNSVLGTSELKLDAISKSVVMDLNTPKIADVKVAKKVSDISSVKNELAKADLDAPKTVIVVPAPVLVAKNVADNSVATEGSLKLSVGSNATAYDVNTPNIKAADKPVLMAKASPVTVAATAKKAYVPSVQKGKIRDYVEAEKGTLLWDNKTKTVTAYVNNCKVEMKIGSRYAKVNGNPVVVNLVPQLMKGRTIIDVTEFKNILESPSLKQ